MGLDKNFEAADQNVQDKVPVVTEPSVDLYETPIPNRMTGDSRPNPWWTDSTLVSELKYQIAQLYREIPTILQAWPEIQGKCLEHLQGAEDILSDLAADDNGRGIIRSRQAITRVRIEIARVEAQEMTPEVRESFGDLRSHISILFENVPTTLKASPAIQSQCLDYLIKAEEILARRPLQQKDIIESRRAATQVEIELIRASGRRRSFLVVGALVYILGGLAALAHFGGFFEIFDSGALETNNIFFVGVPVPVWLWAVVGSFTSMLLRAGQFPFSDLNEAVRWLLFRPIVGVVMGVLAYLIVVAGLFVFGGVSQSQTPQLIWVIAFVGSFSDTLSVNLLQRVLGEFRPVESSVHDERGEQDRDQKPVSPTPTRER